MLSFLFHNFFPLFNLRILIIESFIYSYWVISNSIFKLIILLRTWSLLNFLIFICKNLIFHLFQLPILFLLNHYFLLIIHFANCQKSFTNILSSLIYTLIIFLILFLFLFLIYLYRISLLLFVRKTRLISRWYRLEHLMRFWLEPLFSCLLRGIKILVYWIGSIRKGCVRKSQVDEGEITTFVLLFCEVILLFFETVITHEIIIFLMQLILYNLLIQFL